MKISELNSEYDKLQLQYGAKMNIEKAIKDLHYIIRTNGKDVKKYE